MTVSTLKSAKNNAAACDRANRGLGDQTGSGSHLYHKGIYCAISVQKTAGVEEYAAWLDSQTSDQQFRRSVMTPAKLVRLVAMRRRGSSFAECGVGVGMTTASAHRWLNRLPPELAA